MPLFFLSYAQDDNRSGQVQEFFGDLSEAVAGLAGVGWHEAGFIDGQMLLGTTWSHDLADALSTSSCLIALTSPRYVVSDYCGREFRVFADRVDEHERQFHLRPPALVPIRWIPCDRLPSVIGQFQYRNFPTGSVYAQDGLLTLKQRRRHQDEYQDFVDALARHIVHTARDHALPRPAQRPVLAKVTSAFGEPARSETGAGPAAAAPTPRATSARHVYFVLAAGSSAELVGSRPGTEERYGAVSRDWRPYQPEVDAPIGSWAGAIATTKSYGWTVEDAVDLAAVRDWARAHNQIVVLVVDVWSADLPRYQLSLVGYDREVESIAPVLVPWTAADDAAAGGNRRMWDTLARVLPHHVLRNDREVWRTEIPTSARFQEELEGVLVVAQGRIYRTGTVYQEPTSDGPGQRPILEGP
ncbi:TIR-like protein FxsC [Micromonospora sp. WMMD812]|uniref:TIR-like protein FxsC n=1 Tax=Micromonospora sp. WMMD812 TaxID=3015152 RepID=UPI00248B79CC|nr:TIR-like protein FxsC [Micromonospora sp. WMMD812]WBB68129.1 TIR-like protein FxsC [Micromonospora sp. WMMD812]